MKEFDGIFGEFQGKSMENRFVESVRLLRLEYEYMPMCARVERMFWGRGKGGPGQ